MQVWICGQYVSGDWPDTIWTLQGVYSTKENAISACRSDRYFVAQLTVDAEAPDDVVNFPDIEWPLPPRDSESVPS